MPEYTHSGGGGVDQFVSKVRDAARGYKGGDAELDLVREHPGFVKQMHELWDHLASEQAIRAPLLKRPPFVTITVGNFASVPDLKRALSSGCYDIDDQANALMNHQAFTLLAEPNTLDIYLASNVELGYRWNCTVRESFEALEMIGAEKLPPEAGPQLRLQYTRQQPIGEPYLMYMDPIAGPSNYPKVFSVISTYNAKHRIVRHLDGCYAALGDRYAGERVWVYTRKRPS